MVREGFRVTVPAGIIVRRLMHGITIDGVPLEAAH